MGVNWERRHEAFKAIHDKMQEVLDELQAKGYTLKDFNAAGDLVDTPGSGKRIVVRTAYYYLDGTPTEGAYFQFGTDGKKFLPNKTNGVVGLTLLGVRGGDDEKLTFVMTGTTVEGFVLYKTEAV